ncbi:MAG: hypothetical protein ACKVT2_08005 [Saprospiraceae bacterium]
MKKQVEIKQTVERYPNKQFQKLAAYFAPGILVLIALFQIAIAGTGRLSPWKGGGFGMFSTIESPSTRIVKSYLGTSRGRIPVQVPGSFSKEEERIRTKPTQQACDGLAKLLMEGVWVPYNMVSAQQQYLQDTDSSSSSLNKALAELNMVRLLPPDEKSDQQIQLEYVEVICYQVRMDSDQNRLFLEPIITSHHNAH